jgi:Response regulators consisting of a CheY-like receiver domain and a winged-helix DNA-binding domain
VTRVLVVEDDPNIGRLLQRSLTDRGDVVSLARTGADGLTAALSEQPEIVLLDLGLPDLSGLQVLSMLRAVSSVPVIVVTAQDDDKTVVQALDSGADDYLVKPFASEQLGARIRAVLRRAGAAAEAGTALVIGGLSITLANREAELDGVALELTRKEFDLLWTLASRAGEVVTKQELLAEVWHQPYGGGDRTVDVHLSWLRRKLGETAAEPRYLQTVRGVGLKLVAPEPEA